MSERPSNIVEFTVSGIAAALKNTVEDSFGHVRVRGEISGYRGPHSSGHAYFSLKDDKARLDAVVWRTTMQRLRFRPEEGLEVIATGKLSTHPAKSQYQLIVDSLEPAGAGALMALLEDRRRRLAAEGLFDVARKRPLPFLPRVIGVVTSPTGAVIRDILHRLRDRFPVRVIVWPVRVQGETAAAEVAAAIAGFSRLGEPGGPAGLRRPDLLIVARGGGSLEDLWAFNEEIVVRAAAASAIPLISAIGHETDTTLIDHVADRRAPTPTGAAEMAVPVRLELLARVEQGGYRHAVAIGRSLSVRRRDFVALCRALPSGDDILAAARRSFDELAARFGRSLGANTLAHRAALARVAARLSPGDLRRAVDRQRERFRMAAARSRQALLVHAERKRAGLAALAQRHRPQLLRDRLQGFRQALATATARKQRSLLVHAERKRTGFAAIARRLQVRPLAERIGAHRGRLAETSARLARGVDRALDRAWDQFDTFDKLLAAFRFSKESILARGYALVVDARGQPVGAAAAVLPGAALEIEFHDGGVAAVATGAGRLVQRPRRRRRAVADPDLQGSLFGPTDGAA